jgi:hypothetical protein
LFVYFIFLFFSALTILFKMAFKSIFNINGQPILPPVITDKIRQEIEKIRELCRAKEELKNQKEQENEKKRHGSFTISTPTFSHLPEVNSVEDEEGINGENKSSLVADEEAKTEEEINRSCKKEQQHKKHFNEEQIPQVQTLIKRQKDEYLNTVNSLKKRFISEQQQLLFKLQSSMQTINTSTPLQNVSFAATEDSDFADFQTCLNNIDTETTLTDDMEGKEKAATIINACARGYLVRRLLKTKFVQECIRNVQDTLQLILTFDSNHHKNDEIQDILLKTKLYQQLQGDLYRFSGVFNGPVREKMELISSDRERRIKK